MPSWVVTEPDLALELTYALVGASILGIEATCVLQTSRAKQTCGFLSWSPLFAFPACAMEPAPLLLMDWQASAIHTVRQLQMCPCGLHLATRPVLVSRTVIV